MTEKTPKKTQLVGASYLTTRILNRATNILISVPCELSLRHFFPQVVWVVTFVAVLLLGVDLGLAVGVLGLLVTVVLRVYKPQVTVRGALGNTDIYRDIEKFEKVRFFFCLRGKCLRRTNYFITLHCVSQWRTTSLSVATEVTSQKW